MFEFFKKRKQEDAPAAQHSATSEPAQPVSAPAPQECEVATITLSRLEELDGFVVDHEASTAFRAWSEGAKLIKRRTYPLAGTTLAARPELPLRIYAFAQGAQLSSDPEKNPWSLAGIARRAFFVLVDVYSCDGCTQYTIVEVEEEDIATKDFLLEDAARQKVRGDFDASFGVRQPAYAKSDDYRAIAWRAHDKSNTSADLEVLAGATLTEVKHRFTDGRFSAGDYRFKTLYTYSAPGLGEYRLIIQKDFEGALNPGKDNRHGFKNGVFHIVRVSGGEMEFVLKGFGDTIVSVDHYLPNYLLPNDHSLFMTFKEAMYSTPGYVEVPYDGGKAKRVGTFVCEPKGAMIFTYEPEYARLQSRFKWAGEAVLYLYVHAAREAWEIEAKLLARDAEDLERAVEHAPAHEQVFFARDRLVLQALDWRQMSNPDLLLYEARLKTEAMHQDLQREILLDVLMRGGHNMSLELGFDNARNAIWEQLGKLNDLVLYPSDGLEGFLSEFEEFRREYEGTELELSEEHVNSLVADAISRFGGDEAVCEWRFEQRFGEVNLPVRYEISTSYEQVVGEARINVFLPDERVFPYEFANTENVQFSYWHKTRVLNEREHHELYATAMAQLVLRTVGLVKHCHPWARTILLNAWQRGADGPVCVCSMKADESVIVKQSTAKKADDLAALKRAKGKFKQDDEGQLLPVKPAFNLVEGLDHCYGFKRFGKGWTMPLRYPQFGEEVSEEGLATATQALRDAIKDKDLELGLAQALRWEERCDLMWVGAVPAGARAISTDNELEDAMAAKALEGQSYQLLPHGLGTLHKLLAVAYNDLGNSDEARRHLERAIELNPVSANTYQLYSCFEEDEGDPEAARKWMELGYRYAWNPKDVGFTAMQMAKSAVKAGNSELGFDLWCLSALADHSPGNLNRCFDGMSAVKGHEMTSFKLDPVEIAGRVRAQGIEAGLSPCVMDVVEPAVQAALDGGKTPHQAYVLAWACDRGLRQMPDDQVLDLLAAVKEQRFGSALFTSYLYRPVRLGDLDAPYMFEEIDLGPQEVNRDSYVIGVPYLEKNGRLKFDVIGSVDGVTGQVIKLVPDDMELTLDAKDLRGWGFLAIRQPDYPEVDFFERIAKLSERCSIGEQRAATRAIREIDHLRNFENPDEVMVLLDAPDKTTEAVWMMLEYADESGVYASLATKSFDDFGIKKGEACKLELREDAETGRMIAWVRGR